MSNADIRDLENQLVNTLNNSDVIIEVKRIVVQNVLNLVKEQADKTILNEINKGDENEQSISENDLC